jgi:ATP-binding cassette subfamily C protein
MALPNPSRSLTVENASIAPPGEQRLVLQDMNFALKAGSGLGIIGPSASGKSSLARMMVGVWQPVRGKVRLDNAALDQWDFAELGKHVGYLPQDVELLAGTVAENIARFEREVDAKAIIAAAEAAGVHDMIVSLREGYETQVGEQGAALSAGQQQRIALARALYRDPFLVVLDEPNSNLDAEGEEALSNAILAIRRRGGIVVVIAHRPSALAGVDLVLVMGGGRQQAFGVPRKKFCTDSSAAIHPCRRR